MRVCEIAEKLNLNDEPCTLYRLARAGVALISVGLVGFIVYILAGLQHTIAFLALFLVIYGVVIAVFLKINRRYDTTKTWKLRVQEVAFLELSPIIEILIAIIGILFFHLLMSSTNIPDKVTYSFMMSLSFAVVLIIVVLKGRYGISVACSYRDSRERFIKLKHRLEIHGEGNFLRYGDVIIAHSDVEGELRIYHAERNTEKAKKIMEIADSL